MKEKAPISVVVGELVNPRHIETEQGETIPIGWQNRAKWSYLRLVYGRKIDDTIKAHKEDRPEFMDQLLIGVKQERPLQFIMSANEVVAVATQKHLLIPPEQVYATARQIIGEPLSSHEGIYGQTYMFGEFAGIKTGVQIDGGDLTTRFAIRVGVFARVEMCFNPLSWLGVSGLSRFRIPSDYERVLRIKKLNELFPRLEASIYNAKDKLGDLKGKVDRAKHTFMSSPMALTLTGAMGMAYGLGAKTIAQVMDRFKAEHQTQYGLAMAQSWTAQHGKHRRTPEEQTIRVPQSLSTISGATLLIDDIKTAEDRCKKWLGNQKSKLAEDLLAGRLP